MDHFIHEPPTDVKDGANEKIVQRALSVITDGEEQWSKHRISCEKIRETLDDAFSTEDPKGQLFIEQKIVQNVCKKVIERLDFLDFEIQTFKKKKKLPKLEEAAKRKAIAEMVKKGMTEQEANDEYVLAKLQRRKQEKQEAKFRNAYMKAGVIQILKESGWFSAFHGKGGVYPGIVHYGDKFARPVAREDGFPVQIEVCSADMISVPKGVTDIRNAPRGETARMLTMTSTLSYDEYVHDIAGGNVKGEKAKVSIGGMMNNDVKLNEEYEKERKVDVVTHYDLLMREQAMIVGGKKTVVEHLKKYPHQVKGSNVIPVAHFIGIPSLKGFYNWGVAHYMFQIGNVKKIVENKGLHKILKEIDPLHYIQGIPGGANMVNALVNEAQSNIQSGTGTGIIYDEPDASGNYATGNVQTLTPAPTANIGELAEVIVDRNITEFGVGMQEVQTDSNKTAAAVTIEQETANLLIKGIARGNAPETKILIELVIEAAKKLVPTTNDIRVDTSKIIPEDEMQEAVLEDLTIGDIIAELKETDVVINMEHMRGIAANDSVKAAIMMEMLPALQKWPISVDIAQQALELSTGVHSGKSGFQNQAAEQSQGIPEQNVV